MQELTLLFKLYNDLQVEDLRQQHMERYLVFIKENHKVAITTHRILNISGIDITFKYKDYKDGNKQKELTLSHEEFLRRFEQHILPKGFVKIRHSGFLSHQHKTKRLKSICQQLAIAPPPPKVKLPVSVLAMMKYGVDIGLCSVCKSGRIERVATYSNIARDGVHLVNVAELQNRGSPPKTTNSCCMKMKLITENPCSLKVQYFWVGEAMQTRKERRARNRYFLQKRSIETSEMKQ